MANPTAKRDDAAPTGDVRRARTGRRPGDSRTREDIADAARELFAKRGYAGTTIRAIAARAQVDGALVHHFYTDKAGVFAAAVADIVPLSRSVAQVVHQADDNLPTELLRLYLDMWESEAGDAVKAIYRSSLADPTASGLLRDTSSDKLNATLAQAIDAPDADLRAAVVGAILFGIAASRHLLGLTPLEAAKLDSVIAIATPALAAVIAPGKTDGKSAAKAKPQGRPIRKTRTSLPRR